MRYLLLFLFCLSVACTGVDTTTSVWPAPKFTEADYLAVAQEICSNPNPDPKKLVFSAVLDGFHNSGSVLFFRNGHTYLHVNESCDMWILQYEAGDNMLAKPLHKRIGPELLAHILMGYRTLELHTFDEAGQTNFSYVLSPSWRLFYFKGATYAFDLVYGPSDLGATPEDLNPLEVLVASILQYDPLMDPLVLEGLTPYIGDRLWINVLNQIVATPDRLLQPWPLSQSLEDLGPNYGCSDHFATFTGEDAEALRAARATALSQAPADTIGHFAVSMQSNDHQYWVTMSEGLPMEDEFGFVTFRDARIIYTPCD